jgi:hypothetical protein
MKNLNTISILVLVYLSFVIPINAQIISEGAFAQFLYTDFTDGKVTFKNGTSNSFKLNFNTLTGKIVYLKDGALYDIVNPDIIDTIFLHQTKFIPIENTFFEVLLDAPISFYVQYIGKLLSPENRSKFGIDTQIPNVELKTLSGASYGDKNFYRLVRIDLIYWIKFFGKMVTFANKSDFLKLYPIKKPELEQFIKQNHIKFYNPSDVKRLVEYFNTITL